MDKSVKSTEEHRISDILLSVSKVFFFCFLLFTIGFIIVYSILDDESFDTSDEIKYIEKWTVEDSSWNTFEAGRYFMDNKVYDGDFSITSRLPENIDDNEVLCFIANIEVTVFIDGKIRRDFNINENFMLPAGHVKRFYATIPLSKNDSGAEIKMVRSTPSSHPEVVPETFVTTMFGVYGYLFKFYGVSFSLSVMLLVFSLIVIAVAIGMLIRYRRKIVMLFGALGIMIVAAWLVTNSYLYPFVFGHYHVDGVANYMFCLMIPFGFVIYLDSIQDRRYSRIMTGILVVSALNALIWTVLNFTGILPFVDALEYIDIILGVLILTAVIILIIDIKRGNISKYKYTAIGFFFFLFFCGVVIASLMFLNFLNDDIPMLLGLTLLLIFVVFQQVEDLKKINDEKQRAIDLSDAKTRFLASMSHEIRTPINSILGMNEIILKENKDEIIDNYSRTIRSSGRMLLTLVNDVLDFSKIEAGRIEIAKEEYRLSRVFLDIMPMLAERASSKNLKFKTKFASDIPDGQVGDEYRLKQIITNLISNAVKYTDKGGIDVLIDGRYKDNNEYDMSISVSDTGRGIKKEDLGTLFDAFTRADRKKNSNIEGTGLGLAIVKNIVDSMGGKISVNSEYGKGSEFTVIIPVGIFDRTPVMDDFSNYSEEKEETYECDYTSDAKVLAVDDNKANLTIVRLFLKETGIAPELCSSGNEAIELCKARKYDLILLDHMMPAPDGMETLRAIREEWGSLNKDTTVLVLTANAIAGSREMYLAAGFADYLMKPIDSKKLIKIVKKYLPADKVYPKNEDDFIEEFAPENSDETDTAPYKAGKGSLRESMSSAIEGFDYDVAMAHCGEDEGLLKEILGDICREHEDKIARMKEAIKNKDYDMYCIDAHSMKGIMATVGIMKLSERAKKHELAAKGNDTAFIENDYEDFLDEYSRICSKIKSQM